VNRNKGNSFTRSNLIRHNHFTDTDQPVLGDTPVKKWTISLEQTLLPHALAECN